MKVLQDLASALVDTIDDEDVFDRVMAKVNDTFARHKPQTVMRDALRELEPADAPRARRPLTITDTDDERPKRSKFDKPQDLL